MEEHGTVDVTQAVRLEYESLVKYQYPFHYSEDGDSVRSRIGGKLVKSSWASHFTEPMGVVSSELALTTSYNFNDNIKHEFLLSATLIQNIHSVHVKEEYRESIRICWTRNLLHHILVKCQLKFDDRDGPGFDSVYLDDYHQCIRKDSDSSVTESYEREIGNLLYLTEWSNILPSHVCSLSLPFTFDRDFLLAFPNFLMTKPVVIQVIAKNKIESLMRMGKITGDGTIIEIPFNSKYIENFSSVKKFSPPTLYGEYAKVEPRELEQVKEDFRKRGEIVMEDIISRDEPNLSIYGKMYDIKLSHSFPCHYAIVVAENVKSTANRNFSNYSTDVDDPSKGYSPIKSVSLLYGSSVKIPHLPSPFHSHIFQRKYFGKVSNKPGYAVIPVGFKCGDFAMDTTAVPEEIEMSLQVLVSNTDPMLTAEMEASAASRVEEPQDDDASEISTITPSVTGHSSGVAFRLKTRLCVFKRYKLKDGTFELIGSKPRKD